MAWTQSRSIFEIEHREVYNHASAQGIFFEFRRQSFYPNLKGFEQFLTENCDPISAVLSQYTHHRQTAQQRDYRR